MDNLPNEILRLWPQHLPWISIRILHLVCKLWCRLFSLPSEIEVYLEFWQRDTYCDDLIDYAGTALLGQKVIPKLADPVLYMEGDWRRCYLSWIVKLPLKRVDQWLRGEQSWKIASAGEAVEQECLATLITSNQEYTLRTIEERDIAMTPNLECAFWLPTVPHTCLSPEELDAFFFQLVVAVVGTEPPENSNYLALDEQGRMCYLDHHYNGKSYRERIDAQAGTPMRYITLRESEIEWYNGYYTYDMWFTLKRIAQCIK